MSTFVIILVFSALISFTVVESQIKQLHIIFRHGERTPTETYKTDPYRNYSWPSGWGHLTNRGKLQMFTLGESLRTWYQEGISEFYKPEEVKVMSSYSPRCIASAQCLLAGLFPPKGEQVWNENLIWQPIPVHDVPRNRDRIIVMKAACKKYDKELKSVRESRKYAEINRNNSNLYEYLTKSAGQPVDTILAVEFLYNTLEIEMLHGLELPNWVKNVSLDQMKEIAAMSLAQFVETDFMKRVKGGMFLKHVISSMKHPNNRRYDVHLYAGHDISIVNIIQALGHEKLVKPGFGASIALELHEDNTVRVFYRNDFESEAQEIPARNCSNCNLQQFENGLANFIPIDFEAECEN